ncbi:MAG: low molecular weight phosphotyrosine protein phosphatase [Deltaproteobacteria bacterium]|nr:low molecular weight phosphotyrosine protein phosphatase [Deltaproteobacteria bacterium]
MNEKKFGVLFVCYGNICRSPLGEGIFSHLVEEAGLSEKFVIDSCGTSSMHQGEAPHRESCLVASKHGLNIIKQRARGLRDDDFLDFDLILALDEAVCADILERRLGNKATIKLLREYEPQAKDLNVPDPYYGGRDGFEKVYQMIDLCCRELLKSLSRRFSF